MRPELEAPRPVARAALGQIRPNRRQVYSPPAVFAEPLLAAERVHGGEGDSGGEAVKETGVPIRIVNSFRLRFFALGERFIAILSLRAPPPHRAMTHS
jgi:hypothetical protein